MTKTPAQSALPPRLTELPAFAKLQANFQETHGLHMRRQFAVNPDRFKQFSIQLDGLLLDYSKNRITAETLSLLCQLAEQAGVADWRAQMFAGEKINNTEGRAVLHTALRNRSDTPVLVDGEDVMPAVNRVIEQMGDFAERVRDGDWLGYTGKPIHDVVNIGIGGSDLGPQMVVQALRPYQHKRLKTHFVSNVDGAQIHEVLGHLDPETTLFIVSSKTFTTQETITNARAARRWLLQSVHHSQAVAKHFVAVSTNIPAVTRFGIDADNIFEFWDWVGGRYSLWSAIGLSIVLAVGKQHFIELLEGAHEMDQHFLNAPLEQNMPVVLALLGVWYSNFYGAETHAILPYDYVLRRLPMYLEQADMESNGKSVDRDGRAVDYATGPVIWGASGINGQHAFYQLIHQGTRMIPADLIVSMQAADPDYQAQHSIMIANTFAQAEALMRGRNLDETFAGIDPDTRRGDEVQSRIRHMVFAGNHPSNMLLLDKITPHSLGMLLALYEHKIFVQGIIWNLNSFDQWGVELGKQLTQLILEEFEQSTDTHKHDASTNTLINRYRHALKSGGVSG